MSALADILSIAAGILLWIPGYRASLIKLASVTLPDPAPGGGKAWSRLKISMQGYAKKRDTKWSARHHLLLILGFASMVLSSILKLFIPN
jgi:hypothetical protein